MIIRLSIELTVDELAVLVNALDEEESRIVKRIAQMPANSLYRELMENKHQVIRAIRQKIEGV